MTGSPPTGGFFIQSSGGDRGNFEVVIPWREGGLAHFWRDNDDPALPWRGPTVFGYAPLPGTAAPRRYVSCTLAESDFKSYDNDRPSNFEVFAQRADGSIDHYWRENGGGWHWREGLLALMADSSGNPSLTVAGRVHSSRDHTPFHLIVPRRGGGIECHRRCRQIDTGNQMFWEKLEHIIGEDIIYVNLCSSAIFAAEAAYIPGRPGIFHILAVTRQGQLQLYAFRYQVKPLKDAYGWHRFHGPYSFGGGWELLPEISLIADGRPSMIESSFGRTERPLPFTGKDHWGNLEVVVPLRGGRLKHLWKINGEVYGDKKPNEPRKGWHEGPVFGEGPYVQCSLIQGNFGRGDDKNLELVAWRQNQMGFDFYWRDEDMIWHGPSVIA